MTVITKDNPLPVAAASIMTKFRDAFESYVEGALWTQSLGSGDLILLDGNAAAASYLVISKDPLTPDSTTTLDSNTLFDVPIELSAGLHLSQRTYGQEFAVEVISTEPQVACVRAGVQSGYGSGLPIPVGAPVWSENVASAGAGSGIVPTVTGNNLPWFLMIAVAQDSYVAIGNAPGTPSATNGYFIAAGNNLAVAVSPGDTWAWAAA